jgi:hypothetical protein
VPRRIELELTSARQDGTWTWRAAGAREPKGVLDGSLLPGGAKVGDILRADADFDLDGITVTAVLPPKDARKEPDRLELLGGTPGFEPVTQTLVAKSIARVVNGTMASRRLRDRDRPPAPPEGDRSSLADAVAVPSVGERRPDAEAGRCRRAPGQPPTRPRSGGRNPAPGAQLPMRPKPSACAPSTHRNEVLRRCRPSKPVAEQVLRGGVSRPPGHRANAQLR